MAYLLNEILI